MLIRLPRWRALRFKYLALSPAHRLQVMLISALALIVTALIVYEAVRDDERFYNRANIHVPHDVEALGMDSAEWLSNDISSIPPKIWQIYLAPPGSEVAEPEIPPKLEPLMTSWRKKNPKHEYNLVRDARAAELVRKHFPRNEELQRIFSAGGSSAMKSDLLRYLLLYREGGVYSDMDTNPMWPIDTWIPQRFRGRNVRLVIGLEFDRLNAKNWKGVHYDLQFCQWTMAAAPGHRVFGAMIARAMLFLHELLEERGVAEFSKLKPSTNDVLTTTGPAAWTDAVFQELRAIDPSIQSLRDLSGLKEERLIGDILILPIDGFGAGQRHSGSTRGKPAEEARVRHRFGGSWKDKK